MADRWTMQGLHEITDIDFAAAILRERFNRLSNRHSPLADKIEQAIRTLSSLKQSGTCTWSEDDGCLWECSGCDIAWQFLDDGDPEGNDMNFCPKCGKKITEMIPYGNESEDSE